MRAIPIILTSALVLLFVPYSNAQVATCDDARDGCWCGPYTWIVGGPREGLGVTEHGTVQVAAGETAGWYVFVDSPASMIAQGSLFSIWLYPESNGMEGAQRGDEVCDDCDGGARCDADVLLP